MALTYLVTGLTKGKTYAFRYKVKNEYGWSSYSPVSKLLVATEPTQPAPPIFVQSSNTHLQVLLNLDIQENGSEVFEYGLEISTDGVTFSNVANYDTVSPSYSLSKIEDSLVTGTIYYLRFRARNSIGWGPYSSNLVAALAAPPATPSVPIRDDSLSDKTTVAFRWPAVVDGPGGNGAAITGYRVYMAKGLSGTFALVFDGKTFRTITSFVVPNLVTGQLYRVKISAFNFNGEGAQSSEMITYACIAPQVMDAPIRLRSTSTTLEL